LLDWQRYGCERAAACGVAVEQVVNTWPADKLLSWTASHAVTHLTVRRRARRRLWQSGPPPANSWWSLRLWATSPFARRIVREHLGER
jgi:hypothetical protein